MQIKTFKPQDHKIKALIYGPSGAGKTVFAGTAKKVIFASAESGLLSVKDKKVDFTEIKSVRDLIELHSFLSNEEHDYEVVVVDSITEINEIIKMEIERKTGHALQLQDWGKVAKQIRDIFRKFRDLPMDVILVAQESYITDEDKIRKIVPSLNGKAATEIAYFMDIVGYINVEADGTRWIETNSNKKLLTKDRSDLIGNETELDFTEWQKKVKKIKTGKQKVSVDYEVPVPEEVKRQLKPVNMIGNHKHLRDLYHELANLGAKNKKEALTLLNSLLGTKIKHLRFSEADASKLLIRLLQVPSVEVDGVKVAPVKVSGKIEKR